jgi:hypothetical protein
MTIKPHSGRSPAGAHDGDDLLHLRWIGRVTHLSLLRAGGRHENPGLVRRSTTTGTIEQQLGHDPSSGSRTDTRIKAPQLQE